MLLTFLVILYVRNMYFAWQQNIVSLHPRQAYYLGQNVRDSDLLKIIAVRFRIPLSILSYLPVA